MLKKTISYLLIAFFVFGSPELVQAADSTSGVNRTTKASCRPPLASLKADVSGGVLANYSKGTVRVSFLPQTQPANGCWVEYFVILTGATNWESSSVSSAGVLPYYEITADQIGDSVASINIFKRTHGSANSGDVLNPETGLDVNSYLENIQHSWIALGEGAQSTPTPAASKKVAVKFLKQIQSRIAGQTFLSCKFMNNVFPRGISSLRSKTGAYVSRAGYTANSELDFNKNRTVCDFSERLAKRF